MDLVIDIIMRSQFIRQLHFDPLDTLACSGQSGFQTILRPFKPAVFTCGSAVGNRSWIGLGVQFCLQAFERLRGIRRSALLRIEDWLLPARIRQIAAVGQDRFDAFDEALLTFT
ncbi:hypothetical protein SDC9_107497 [bioreactor metagenome]|uniref:Uncharacterized protein n=1 Tax=bioreactor metagenome TaxID=1076179 RepID=A0A645B5D7_9ZZZZ